ncbi:MAG: sigma-70 family RNA polymerase sigma factor [Candidatus Krumholzibacteriota bacterium]
MSPRDLYSMDDGDDSSLTRPESKTGEFPEFPDGDHGPDGEKDISDLEIEKKFLQLTRIDTEQFKFFYEKYHDVIFNYVYLKTEDYELTGDLTGDVFLEALDKLDKFTWQGYSFGAWLFHIARRKVARHYRRKSHPAEKVFQSEIRRTNQPARPDQDAVRNQDLELVRECMRSLGPDKHDALVLHYWLDLTVREIALIMKTSESNVKKHLVRGRRQMLKWFRDNGLDWGLSEIGQKVMREAGAHESGWHLVDDLTGK